MELVAFLGRLSRYDIAISLVEVNQAKKAWSF